MSAARTTELLHRLSNGPSIASSLCAACSAVASPAESFAILLLGVHVYLVCVAVDVLLAVGTHPTGLTQALSLLGLVHHRRVVVVVSALVPTHALQLAVVLVCI